MNELEPYVEISSTMSFKDAKMDMFNINLFSKPMRDCKKSDFEEDDKHFHSNLFDELTEGGMNMICPGEREDIYFQGKRFT